MQLLTLAEKLAIICLADKSANKNTEVFVWLIGVLNLGLSVF